MVGVGGSNPLAPTRQINHLPETAGGFLLLVDYCMHSTAAGLPVNVLHFLISRLLHGLFQSLNFLDMLLVDAMRLLIERISSLFDCLIDSFISAAEDSKIQDGYNDQG
jgi:hypothetical protein